MLTTETGIIRSYVVEDRGTLRYAVITPDPEGCPYYGGCPSCYPTACNCYTDLNDHIQETIMADWNIDSPEDLVGTPDCPYCPNGQCECYEPEDRDQAEDDRPELMQTKPPAPEGQAALPGLFYEQPTMFDSHDMKATQ